jgi:hypothetical protein
VCITHAADTIDHHESLPTRVNNYCNWSLYPRLSGLPAPTPPRCAPDRALARRHIPIQDLSSRDQPVVPVHAAARRRLVSLKPVHWTGKMSCALLPHGTSPPPFENDRGWLELGHPTIVAACNWYFPKPRSSRDNGHSALACIVEATDRIWRLHHALTAIRRN